MIVLKTNIAVYLIVVGLDKEIDKPSKISAYKLFLLKMY